MKEKYSLIVLITALTGLFAFTTLSYKKSGDHEENNTSLVGHWSFDEKEGDIIYDKSTYERHGKAKGDPKKAKGAVGNGCMEFDGDGDYVEILENGKTPSHLQNLGEGSISIWFKARNIPVGENILPVFYYGNKNGCRNMFDASNEGLIIEVAHGRVFRKSQGVFFTIFSNHCSLPSFCYDSHSDVHPYDEQGIIEENKWYHFVAVVDKNYNTGYLNGQEIYYRRYNFNSASASQFFEDALKHERMWIGKGFWNHARETYFDGFIDDLRIYNKPLTQDEVQALYTMGNP